MKCMCLPLANEHRRLDEWLLMALAGSLPRMPAMLAILSRNIPATARKIDSNQYKWSLMAFKMAIGDNYQILSFDVGHLLHNAPQPPFEFQQFLAAFARLIVERGVGDQCTHMDVAHTVQQQSQVFGSQELHGITWQDIENTRTKFLMREQNENAILKVTIRKTIKPLSHVCHTPRTGKTHLQ